jgi:hypothetical protein
MRHYQHYFNIHFKAYDSIISLFTDIHTGFINIGPIACNFNWSPTVEKSEASSKVGLSKKLPLLSMYPHFPSISTAANPSEKPLPSREFLLYPMLTWTDILRAREDPDYEIDDIF